MAVATRDQTAPSSGITFGEFLEWLDSETHAEWVDGEVVEMSPVSDEHASLASFLHRIVSDYVARHHLGEVRYEPYLMRTGPDLPARSPDLLYIAEEHFDRRKRHFLDGPADLAVEIVSPDSSSRDRGEKFVEYERGGVTEYWIIDPIRRTAQFHHLDDTGVYQPLVAVDGVFRSRVLEGFSLHVDWLWQDAKPDPDEVLAAWAAHSHR